MSLDLIRAQNARHKALRDFAIGYKLAEVTDLDPLTVSPSGGGEVPALCIEGVECDVADAVVTVDLGPGYPPVILGRIGGRMQTSSTTVTGNGTPSRSVTVSHNLAVTPRVIHAVTNDSNYNAATGGATSTTFTLQVEHVDATNWSGDITVRWTALP